MKKSSRHSRSSVATTTLFLLFFGTAILERKSHVCALMQTSTAPSFNRPSSYSSTTSSRLFLSSSPPPPRQPRRMMKKRRRKENDNKRRFLPTSQNGNSWNNNNNNYNSNFKEDGVTTEYRPLVPSVRRDLGEDYWIDPADLEKERQRELVWKQKQKAPLSGKNAIPKEKLWSEVKAPYRQNWIGYFSVFIAVLSMIVLKFPELLDTPTIPYPDL